MSKKKPLKRKRKKIKYVTPTYEFEWEITIDKEGFDKLRSDHEFILILNLARATNSLSFCYESIIYVNKDGSPASYRQIYYASSFAASVLYEGLRCARKLADYFVDFDSYQKGFEVLLKDPIIEEIMKPQSRFDRLRNRVTYHFNEDIFERVLPWVEFDSYIFGRGKGHSYRYQFYSLAEDIALNFIIDEKNDSEKGKQVYEEMWRDISRVMIDFFSSSQSLIAEVLLKKGWKINIVGDATKK